MVPVKMPEATHNKGLCVCRKKYMMFSIMFNLLGFGGGNLLFPSRYLKLLALFCTLKSGKNSLRFHLRLLFWRALGFFP